MSLHYVVRECTTYANKENFCSEYRNDIVKYFSANKEITNKDSSL